MIEFLYVANLVDDDVVTDLWWQKDQFVIEVKITLLGTATPTALLIPDSDPANDDAVSLTIVLNEMFDALMYDRSRRFPIGDI
jgi:hypothetical protein